MIVALDQKRGIGRDNRLPWHLSTDLKRFRALSIGHHVIMGRKTFTSIGKPLPGRHNIVITRSQDFKEEGIIVFHSLMDAITFAKNNDESEVFIIGGGQVFSQGLKLADRLYMTYVHTDSYADTFFPVLDNNWILVSAEEFPAGSKDDFPSTFCIYHRA